MTKHGMRSFLDQITCLVPIEQLLMGDEQARAAISWSIEVLIAKGHLVRSVFQGGKCVAPSHWVMDATFAAQLATANCHREFGGCLVWEGSLDLVRGPRLSYRRQTILLRRAVYESTTGDKLARSTTVRMNCGCERCLDFQHMVLTSRNQALEGAPRPLTVRKRIADARRKASAFAIEQVRELRAKWAAKEITQPQVARLLGISIHSAGCLLRGETWQDFDNQYTTLIRR